MSHAPIPARGDVIRSSTANAIEAVVSAQVTDYDFQYDRTSTMMWASYKSYGRTRRILVMEKYRLRYFFEWGGGPCLWADNDAAINRFGMGGVVYTDLPLSAQTITIAEQLAKWHDKSLNWDYPPDPGPWRQLECDRFNGASKQLLHTIREELGDEYDVIDNQPVLREDPELDRYLQDPKGFRRSR